MTTATTATTAHAGTAGTTVLTGSAWRARARELAARRGYRLAEVAYLGETACGDALVRVVADSQPGAYAVRVSARDLPVCMCKAGENGRPCKHAGAALAVVAGRRAMLVAAGGGEYARIHTAETRDWAHAARLVWSSRTGQWLTAAAAAEENRIAAIAYTEARRAFHDVWEWWTPALG